MPKAAPDYAGLTAAARRIAQEAAQKPSMDPVGDAAVEAFPYVQRSPVNREEENLVMLQREAFERGAEWHMAHPEVS